MKYLLLIALLFAAPASADLWVHGCTVANVNCTAANTPYDCCSGAGTGDCPVTETSGVVGKTTIRALERACWTFTSADLATTLSPLFHVTSERVRFCLNDDMTSTAATTVAADIHICPDGTRSELGVAERTCPTGTTALPTLANNACIVTDAGTFYGEINAICVAGDVCRVSVEGVDPQRQ